MLIASLMILKSFPTLKTLAASPKYGTTPSPLIVAPNQSPDFACNKAFVPSATPVGSNIPTISSPALTTSLPAKR